MWYSVFVSVHDFSIFSLHVSFTDEAFFDSEEEEDEDNVQKSCLLLQYMLDCLHKIFLYDTQHFLSKERADALLSPLVDQVGTTAGLVNNIYYASCNKCVLKQHSPSL